MNEILDTQAPDEVEGAVRALPADSLIEATSIHPGFKRNPRTFIVSGKYAGDAALVGVDTRGWAAAAIGIAEFCDQWEPFSIEDPSPENHTRRLDAERAIAEQ